MAKKPTETVSPASDAPVPKQRRVRKPFQGAIKLADVARHAGVSTATASRAINTPRLVSPVAREKVEAAILALNWIPHGAAKALASLRTRTIGVLIPTFGHQTIAAMIEALQHELALADYTLLMGWPDPIVQTTLKQAFNMIERGVECLILMGEDQPPELMELLERRNIFYVIAYTSGRYGTKNCIGFDNFLEMSKLAQHLLDLGHTRFGIITRGFKNNDRIRQRIEGVNATLAKEGLAVRPQHFVEVSHFLIGSGREGMQTLLSTDNPPTAVVCANDYLAAGALIEARAAGLSVPDDVSIVGFDDVELAAQIDPPLTTIRVPARHIGHTIARYILDRLDHGESELPGRIEAELVIRGTTAPPRSSAVPRT
jgi:LacI family transcriptional regulator